MKSMPPRGWVGGFVGCRCGRRPRHSWRPIGEPCLHHVYNIPSQATNPNFKVYYYLKLIVCETVGKYRNKVLMRSEGLCADLKGELERCVFSEYYSPKSQSNFNVKQPSTKRCVVSTWINNALMFDKIVHVLFVFFCCISAFLTALSWLSKWRHQGKNVCTRWRGAKRGKGNCDIRSRMWAAQNTKKRELGPVIKCPKIDILCFSTSQMLITDDINIFTRSKKTWLSGNLRGVLSTPKILLY